MAILVRMPEVLANVTEATIQSWLVSEGDSIEADAPFAEIETEKAMVEFNSEHAGTIERLLIEPGETVDVGTPIAVVRESGDSDEDVARVFATSNSQMQSTPSETQTPSPARESESVEHAGFEALQESPGAPSDRRFMSPIVRRLAREHNVDLSEITGTGPAGRIVRRDIDAVLERGGTDVQTPAPLPASTGEMPAESIKTPLTGMRRAIARRLTESKTSVPHFYLTAHCRVDALLALRGQVNENALRKISVNDFVVKAVAMALQRVPAANAIWGGDHIEQFTTSDIAVAVSTDGGLVTPVIRGVESLSLTALSETIADVASRGRAGRLRQHELEGGSFSVSNLGMYGVDEFSAILNPPQSGILAVGAAQEKPVVVDGELAIGRVMTVTLSADHRVVDGAVGAEWLAAFKALIEAPLSMLI